MAAVRLGLTQYVLRWPILVGVCLIIAVECLLYLAVRLLVWMVEACCSVLATRHKAVRRELESATTYQEYVAAARKLDKLEGRDAWKKKKECVYYDYELIEDLLKKLRDFRSKNDFKGLMRELYRVYNSENIGGIQNRELYTETYWGSKMLVHEFVQEVLECTILLRDSPMSTEDKNRFFRVSYKNFGHTALLLSGGAANGYYHLGIVKTLLEAKCLPKIITGSSAGSLIGSFVCTHTDEELSQLLTPDLYRWFCAADEPFWTKFGRWFRTGYIFDAEDWRRKMAVICRGDMTFLEAYQRTGRILNIAITSATKYTPPRVLNYKTAPNVCIWSAVLASSAFPRTIPSVELMCKEYSEVTIHRYQCGCELPASRDEHYNECKDGTSMRKSASSCALSSPLEQSEDLLAMHDSQHTDGDAKVTSSGSDSSDSQHTDGDAKVTSSGSDSSESQDSSALPCSTPETKEVTADLSQMPPCDIKFTSPPSVHRQLVYRLRPFHYHGKKFADGTLSSDIPIKEVATMFGCNFFVVCQVNPHVAPFFYNASGGTGSPSRAHNRGSGLRGGYLTALVERLLRIEMRKWIEFLSAFDLLPSIFGVDWRALWLQSYQGTVTLIPRLTLGNYIRLISDASREQMADFFRGGQRSAWPRLLRIFHRFHMEDVLEKCAGSFDRKSERKSTLGKVFDGEHKQQKGGQKRGERGTGREAKDDSGSGSRSSSGSLGGSGGGSLGGSGGGGGEERKLRSVGRGRDRLFSTDSSGTWDAGLVMGLHRVSYEDTVGRDLRLATTERKWQDAMEIHLCDTHQVGELPELGRSFTK